MTSKSHHREYCIVKCPRCFKLQMAYSSARTHKCPYCDKTITLENSKTKAIYITGSHREASKAILKLKSRRAT